MYKDPPKERQFPTRDEAKKMLTELSELIPWTREQILFRALEKYYLTHKYKIGAKMSGDWQRIKYQLVIDQRHECFYCHKYLSHKQATVDHKIPSGRGGTDDYDNLCAACQPCNNEKGVMNELEFKEALSTGIPLVL